MREADPDEDFTREWEFRHAVENLFKYKLGVPIGTACNAYVSTKMDKACYTVRMC